MLTADLVRARRKGGELVLSNLTGKTRTTAVAVAGALLEATGACVGAKRQELEEAWQAACGEAPKKLADGLTKLVEDRCEFEIATEHTPAELRARVFEAAARARREASAEAPFQREAVVAVEAAALELSPAALEQAMYADLRSEQRLLAFDAVTAERLVDAYERGQAQAVLLRAVEVVCDVWCRDAYAYRALFRTLKFHRLLHRAVPRSDGGYRLHIDGPFNAFHASTKYGLALALSLPALMACDRYALSAALRWGPEREPLTFKLAGEGGPGGENAAPRLPDEVEALRARFEKLGSAWEVAPGAEILEVKGHGLCVPDLRFVHRETGEVVYLEVLGFWSRDAVFRRVEMARAGLDARVLFAVSTRLRVSESVLADAEVPSELYVYKGSLNAREILRRLDGVSSKG